MISGGDEYWEDNKGWKDREHLGGGVRRATLEWEIRAGLLGEVALEQTRKEQVRERSREIYSILGNSGYKSPEAGPN